MIIMIILVVIIIIVIIVIIVFLNLVRIFQIVRQDLHRGTNEEHVCRIQELSNDKLSNTIGIFRAPLFRAPPIIGLYSIV